MPDTPPMPDMPPAPEMPSPKMPPPATAIPLDPSEPHQPISFVVNGQPREFGGPPFRRLIDVLREDLGLTGTKEGCGEGECGACSVLMDGIAVNSCLIPICQAERKSIRTVESLGEPGALSSLQQAFLDAGAAQCGICTPGMLITATAWIEQGGADDPDAIRRVLAGNLCRCTGYQHIIDAVVQAVRTWPRKQEEDPVIPGYGPKLTPSVYPAGYGPKGREGVR